MIKKEICIYYALWESQYFKKGLCFNPVASIFDAQISITDELHCQYESYCKEYKAI